MFWYILGIEPTTDKRLITAAYREMLLDTNPEEKPEQFKALREAYEKALEYANNGGGNDKSSVELWCDKLASLYADFSKRRDVECWKSLMGEKVCKALDTRMAVEDALLRFLMDNYYVSHEVMMYLDEQFSFTERVEELYETYPKDFVDYVILNGINFEDTLPAAMFEPGSDGEQCSKYLQLYNDIRYGRTEDIKATFEAMKALSESHPYGQIMILADEHREGIDRKSQIRELVEKHDFEHTVSLTYAAILIDDDEFAEAEAVCRKALERRPDDQPLKWNLAHALAGQEKYKDAIDILHELMKSAGGDRNQLQDLSDKRAEWNGKLIEGYVKRYEENPQDKQLLIDYSWALLQNERKEEADEISKGIRQEETDPFDYYNLMSNIDFQCDRQEDGLAKIDKLIEVIENLEDDGSEKTKKRIARHAEMIARKAIVLCSMDRNEEGFAEFSKALAIEPEDPELLTQCGELAYFMRDYDKALMYASELVRVKSNAYHGYLLMAKALYMLYNDRDAFDCINKAIEMYGGDLECYIVKLRILIRNDAAEAAEELISFLEENNCGDDLAVMLCKGNYLDIIKNDKDAAFELYKQIIEQYEAGNYFPFADDAYLSYLYIYGSDKDANEQHVRDELFEIIEKGLAFNPENYNLLDYKVWLLRKENRRDEALEILFALMEKYPKNMSVPYQIGDIYYDGDDNDIKEAARYLRIAYELGNENCLFKLAYAYYFMDMIDESEKFCRLLREQAAEQGYIDVDSYARMSYVYEKRRDFQLALEELEISTENAKKRSIELVPYYRHKVRLLRMLNRPEEAVELLKYISEKFDTEFDAGKAVEIYMQFGMVDEARDLIAASIKDGIQTGEMALALAVIQYCEGNPLAALKTLHDYEGEVYAHDASVLSAKIHMFLGEYHKSIDIALSILNGDESRNVHGRVRSLIRVAEVYEAAGDTDNAADYAEQMIEAASELPDYATDMAINKLYYARAYIILGRFQEAEEILNYARNYVCSHCVYCQCKDADLFEVSLLIKKGMYADARQLCLKSIEKWGVEEDFVTELHRINKLDSK